MAVYPSLEMRYIHCYIFEKLAVVIYAWYMYTCAYMCFFQSLYIAMDVWPWLQGEGRMESLDGQ